MTEGLPAEMRAHIELLERELTDWLRAETGDLALSVRYEVREHSDG